MTLNRLGFLLLAFTGISYNAYTQNLTQWSERFKKISENVDQHSAAYGNLKKSIEEIGHRLTGSENGAKGEAFVFNLLQSYGLQTSYQEFESEGWSRGNISLKIGNTTYRSVALAHSPVKADVKANLIDVGNGLEEDYQNLGAAVKNKIALVYLHILPSSKAGLQNLHRSEKTAIATRKGAKGIIFINSAPGDILLTGTASVTGKVIPIPAVCIGNEKGMELKALLKKEKKLQAHITMNNFSGKVKARNVIATLPGKNSAEKVIIGGHLDSWDLATGAIDNGIGSFAVVDVARTFKELDIQPERTIEFVLFMGEEQGLLGSKAYVAETQAKSKLNEIRYMLNFDMTNDPRGFHASVDDDKELFNSAGKIAKQLDTSFKNTYSSGLGLHSDHQPFMLEGIPTAGGAGHLSKEVLQCYHADCDDFNLVNEKELKNTVRYAALLLYAIANAPELKAKRLNDDELKEALLKANLKEPLKIAGEWRWKD